MKRLTTEIFIERAKAIHNDKYDYAKSNYSNCRTEICIICPEHGEFYQSPSGHLSGRGCPECRWISMKRNQRDTVDAFIAKAIHMHGTKYSYDNVNYEGCKKEVKITCPVHGDFMQKPQNHLRGHGCPLCGGSKKATLDEWLHKAKAVHGDKYDYSKVKYVNGRTKVCIVCPKHGDFYQTPDSHLKGRGCKKCANEISSSKKRLSTADFIQKAISVHGDLYDYSKVNYINAQTKVCIRCPIHGEFYQTPNSHTQGNGCKKCSHQLLGEYARLSTDTFVNRSKEIHNDKYDYSKVFYINNNTAVTIICPEHGEFNQLPANHLKGCGCPKCVNKQLDTNDWIEKAKKIHGNKYDYSKVVYEHSRKPVTICCPIHGDFEQLPVFHLQGHGCQKCNSSNGEIITANILKKIDCSYIREKTLHYQDGSWGFVDFWTDYGAIEYDGEQHFYERSFFGGLDEYLKNIERDRKKTEYFKMNGIPLLRIRYDQINEAEKIIQHFINNSDFYKDRCNPYLTNEEYYSIREANGGTNETRAS